MPAIVSQNLQGVKIFTLPELASVLSSSRAKPRQIEPAVLTPEEESFKAKPGTKLRKVEVWFTVRIILWVSSCREWWQQDFFQ